MQLNYWSLFDINRIYKPHKYDILNVHLASMILLFINLQHGHVPPCLILFLAPFRLISINAEETSDCLGKPTHTGQQWTTMNAKLNTVALSRGFLLIRVFNYMKRQVT